jgi:hypothetical protein
MNPLPSLTPPRSEPPIITAERVVAPHWSERIPDRIAYCAWVLEHQPRVTYRFFALANGFVQRNPTKRLSAEATVCVMRFYGSNTNGDEFEVNSNIKSLLGRLYKRAHPDVDIELRRCWLDALSQIKLETLYTAFATGRAKWSDMGAS